VRSITSRLKTMKRPGPKVADALDPVALDPVDVPEPLVALTHLPEGVVVGNENATVGR